MSTTDAKSKSDPRIIGTLQEDIRRGDFGQTIRRDFAELKEYMVDEERKKRLADMGVIKRWLLLAWWLLKSMFFKLTPARRIIIVLGLILLFFSRSVIYSDQHLSIQGQTNGLGVLAILFVLMLELKDKLVAHDELKAGRAVQQALMPEKKPHVDGWDIWLFTRSANEVGGDLVDFMKISERRFGIAIGDVAGKGLSAALLMAKLQATLKALVAEFSSLADLGVKINQIFCRDSLRNIFASMVYCEIMPDSGSVRFVNAGHIPPVIRREGNAVKLEKGGVALGIMPGATYEEQVLNLQSGDMLLIYSDGLTEAQNAAGEFYGEQPLLHLLTRIGGNSAEQTGDNVVGDVGKFVGDSKVHDDLSIVVLQKK